MWDLVTAPETLPFGVSIGLMLTITALEVVTAVAGAGVSNFVETMVPDLEVDVDVDAPEGGDIPALSKLLGWLRVGEVPALILLLLFLLAFGMGGYTVQSIFEQVTGGFLNGWLATIPALSIALPTVHVFGGVLAAVLPRDETEAVHEASFLGQTAVIVLGVARAGSPAEAKLTDGFGTTHYLMVEPEGSAEVAAGQAIELTEYVNGVYRGQPAN
ncbi:MAG: OB-fold-containig protein, partial [Pseudomonadota bacterium]